jgi:vacuolar-type H+-ATPase subunit E/Vma4
MAGAEKIVERILEEARSKAAASIEKAKKEASDIMRSAEEEARNRQKVIIDRAFEEAVERKKRLIAVGELEGRKQKLKAKQEVIEAVFKKAVEELNSLPADEYEKVPETPSLSWLLSVLQPGWKLPGQRLLKSQSPPEHK